MTKVIAFYLPQFHPIPENDEWWGDGFTEWNNVVTARPLFAGHAQPRHPRAMGYYDVRVPETRNKQFKLAREAGIDGFCYYYYWFNGRRLLQRPLNDTIDGRVDAFPFCICWANENWSRRWDGREHELLMEQEHSLESDRSFIRDVLPILAHPDYIKVNGRPILMVYRLDRLVSPLETAAVWREEAARYGIAELHLAAVQSFGFGDPTPFGFDSAVEFPPHFLFHYQDAPEDSHDQVENLTAGFRGHIYDYPTVVQSALRRPRETYQLHRGAMCAWDNTARRGSSATVFNKASPFDYETWVTYLVRDACLLERESSQEQVVFLNAWNEWAEGSVLEPCDAYENSFALATRRAVVSGKAQAILPRFTDNLGKLCDPGLGASERVLLVGHNAARNGAQINLLYFAKQLRLMRVPLTILLLGDGPLLDDYKAVASTYVVDSDFASNPGAEEFVMSLARRGHRRAILNTVATGSMTYYLKKSGFVITSLIHELPDIIDRYGLRDHLGAITQYADNIIFATEFVRCRVEAITPIDRHKVGIFPQGCYRRVSNADRAKAALYRKELRASLGISRNAKIVLGAGYGDWRKGVDLFVVLAQQCRRDMENVHFVWVGDIETGSKRNIDAQQSNSDWRAHLHLLGFKDNVGQIMLASDVSLLTSREDPFPTVVLEALDAGLPVIGFRGAGGAVELENSGFANFVDFLDLDAMRNRLKSILSDKGYLQEVKKSGPAFIESYYSYAEYVRTINSLSVPHEFRANQSRSVRISSIEASRNSIAVIVPSYNTGRYLEKRLLTIELQTVRPNEIIILDDASTDDSQLILSEFALRTTLKCTTRFSANNSGSPFCQWAAGVEQCESELVWIAESDDFCELDLLENLVPIFDDPLVVIAYAHSRPVGSGDEDLDFNYDNYLAEVDPDRWRRSFKMDGPEFVARFLTARNTIPNVSAVVFRRSAALAHLDKIKNYKACGDWLFYALVAQHGKIAFLPTVLNYHRRHGTSVISRSEKDTLYIEELLRLAIELIDNNWNCCDNAARTALITRIEDEYRRHRADDMPEHIGENSRYRDSFTRVTEVRGRSDLL